MDKKRIAYHIENSEDCAKVVSEIYELETFRTTWEWLNKGVVEYPYVIFDEDQWTGANSPMGRKIIKLC